MKKKKTKLIVIIFVLVVFAAVLFNMNRLKTIEAGIDALAQSEVEYIVEKGNIEVLQCYTCR